jgi:hypothetical protein
MKYFELILFTSLFMQCYAGIAVTQIEKHRQATTTKLDGLLRQGRNMCSNDCDISFNATR